MRKGEGAVEQINTLLLVLLSYCTTVAWLSTGVPHYLSSGDQMSEQAWTPMAPAKPLPFRRRVRDHPPDHGGDHMPAERATAG